MTDHPLQAGDRAPDFELRAVNRDGTVSLADYRGKSPVFVALFRGLHCPFCRRQLARLTTTQERLAREGVATLAIVNTQPERARQYFQYRPTHVVLAADPDAHTHRAFGLPAFEILPDSTDPGTLRWPHTYTFAALGKTSVSFDELPGPTNLIDASTALDKRDGFEPTPADEQSHAQHGSQLTGQFIIDAGGTIRWAFIEAPDSADQIGCWPSEEEILDAARRLRH